MQGYLWWLPLVITSMMHAGIICFSYGLLSSVHTSAPCITHYASIPTRKIIRSAFQDSMIRIGLANITDEYVANMCCVQKQIIQGILEAMQTQAELY